MKPSYYTSTKMLCLPIVLTHQLPTGRIYAPSMRYPYVHFKPCTFQLVSEPYNFLFAWFFYSVVVCLIVFQQIDHHVFVPKPFSQLLYVRMPVVYAWQQQICDYYFSVMPLRI